MKTCNKCGAVCEDNDSFCSACGSALPDDHAEADKTPSYPQYPGEPQSQYYPNQPAPAKARTAPLVLGIIGIVFSLLLPIVTYCCSIPGLVMASTDARSALDGSKRNQVLNIVAICIAVINSIIGIVRMMTVGAMMLG